MAAILRSVGEIAFFGLLIAFVRSPGEINPQHRLLFGIIGILLLVGVWLVSSGRSSGPAWRLLLVYGAGMALSLAVLKENLARPPSPFAADCAVALGVLGIAAALVARADWRPTRMESGVCGALLLTGLTLALLFHPVAMQNSLDPSVLRDAVHELFYYALLIAGVLALSGYRRTYARMSLLLAAACLARIVIHHAPPAG